MLLLGKGDADRVHDSLNMHVFLLPLHLCNFCQQCRCEPLQSLPMCFCPDREPAATSNHQDTSSVKDHIKFHVLGKSKRSVAFL